MLADGSPGGSVEEELNKKYEVLHTGQLNIFFYNFKLSFSRGLIRDNTFPGAKEPFGKMMKKYLCLISINAPPPSKYLSREMIYVTGYA